MRRTDEDRTTGDADARAQETGRQEETTYDARRRHAELVHQLRSIHAGLALSTELLLESAGRADDLDPRRLLLLQAGEVAHLGRLLESGADRTGPEEEPRDDLAEVVDLAVGVARLHGQHVTWPGTQVTRRVAARPAHEVLQVILENAREHAPGARVDVEVVERDGTVMVRVHDHGPGLALTPRPPMPGHGLGLRIAAESAADMGARLAVEESDHGACFVLVLPGQDDAARSRTETGGASWSARPA